MPRPFYVAATHCYCFIIFLQVLKMGLMLRAYKGEAMIHIKCNVIILSVAIFFYAILNNVCRG